MIFRFLDWIIDYWVMLNYVFYKFYARREKDPEIRGLIYAPGWVWFNYLTIVNILYLIGIPLLLTFLNHKIFCFVLPYFVLFFFNSIFLYHRKKWKEIFSIIDKKRDTEEVKRKYRNTVIYIWVSIALLLIPALIFGKWL